ncbi:MAG: L-threonylcarbamoyladenylate synthase [Ginsengibacter sp.]
MKDFIDDISGAIKELNKGSIILYPTDTIWGIGCDATNADGIKKIYRLKKREEKKSMIILLADENDIKKYVLHPSEKIIDFISVQKKPTTAIFEQAINLPAELINIDGSIAIRIVKDAFCEMLLQHLKRPLVSTSANISGGASPKNFQLVSSKIKKGVGYIVQHRQNEMELHQPSSIIKLNRNGEIEKIR